MILVLASIFTGSGCSRMFWRQHADRETYSVLAQKMTDERWIVPRVDLQPDPRSRFYDPYDPDTPPLPPDDPDAHQYMEWVHGMLGYQSWHEFGDTLTVENPQWLENFGIPPEVIEEGYQNGYSYENQISRPVPQVEKLTLGDAIELTYIHNRDFQFQLEDLFLTALELTFQRFRYDVQFLGIGGNKPSSDLGTATVPGGATSVDWGNRVGISKLLPTGGQWAAEFANNTLWLFSGDNKTNTASALSFSLVQPLLMGGGRKIALEGLTQAERDSLYKMRDFARFRRTFFAGVVGGRGGYLGLLRLRQAILNQESNIRAIEIQVRRLRELSKQQPARIAERLNQLPADIQFPESVAERIGYEPLTKFLFWTGPMSPEERDLLLGLSDAPAYQLAIRELFQRRTSDVTPLEVAQLETNLAQGKSQLVELRVDFQDSLDRYKIQIGIPTDSVVTLDESLLKPFELIDPRLTTLQGELEQFLELWGGIDDDNPSPQLMANALKRMGEIHAKISEEALGVIGADMQRLQSIWTRRMGSLKSEDERERLSRDVARDRGIFASLKGEFQTAVEAVRRLDHSLQGENIPLKDRQDINAEIGNLREEFLRIVQGLTVVQINTRVELIELPEFELSIEESVRLGMEHRLDLKNERAFVMDSRRLVEVAANRLEAVLDVVVEGDVRTPSLLSGNNNPLDFRGANSNYRVGLAFTAPVVQIQERNDYRAALIAYQRSRRAFIEAEDTTKLQIRDDWRSLEANRARFEIGRQALRSAAIQFDQSVDLTTAPLEGQNRSSGSSLGLNLLRALESVLRAQNNLIRDWVNHETSRLNVYRDMGTMEIDETGVWSDSFYQERKSMRVEFTDIHEEPPPVADLDGSLDFELQREMSGEELPDDGPFVVPPAELPGSARVNARGDVLEERR